MEEPPRAWGRGLVKQFLVRLGQCCCPGQGRSSKDIPRGCSQLWGLSGEAGLHGRAVCSDGKVSSCAALHCRGIPRPRAPAQSMLLSLATASCELALLQRLEGSILP